MGHPKPSPVVAHKAVLFVFGKIKAFIPWIYDAQSPTPQVTTGHKSMVQLPGVQSRPEYYTIFSNSGCQAYRPVCLLVNRQK